MFIYIYIYNINVYLNVNVIVYVYIYITQPTPKFTKHTWREQVDRDVNIFPHPKPFKKKGVRYQLPGTAVGTNIAKEDH